MSSNRPEACPEFLATVGGTKNLCRRQAASLSLTMGFKDFQNFPMGFHVDAEKPNLLVYSHQLISRLFGYLLNPAQGLKYWCTFQSIVGLSSDRKERG